MKKSEQAVDCFLNGFNCSQAVFSTYCQEYGLEVETALKIACGFGAGVGCLGETCGAVSGALMTIGLKYGKYRAEDHPSKEKTYALVKEFISRFEKKNGSIRCKDLLGVDISTAEGYQNAADNRLFRTTCPAMVGLACEILEDLI